jgi:two-component system sensor histidine kinase ChiS
MSRTGFCPNCGSIQPVGEVRERNQPRFWCLTCGSTLEAAQVEGGTSPARPQTILCIDDDRLVLGVCTSALEAHGYRVVTATDGLAGMEMAKQERPGVILLDVMMPGMSGFEVCQLMRTDPDLRETPIVLMTAMGLPDLEAKGAEAGATLSLRKPFNPEQIVSTVEQVLARKGSSETL